MRARTTHSVSSVGLPSSRETRARQGSNTRPCSASAGTQPAGALDLCAGIEKAAAVIVAAAGNQHHEAFEHFARQQVEQPIRRRSRIVQCRLNLEVQGGKVRLVVLDDVFDDGPVQAFLAAEVVLNCRQVRAGALGQEARARTLVPFGREDLECGIENAPPGIFPARINSRPLPQRILAHATRPNTSKRNVVRRTNLSIERYYFDRFSGIWLKKADDHRIQGNLGSRCGEMGSRWTRQGPDCPNRRPRSAERYLAVLRFLAAHKIAHGLDVFALGNGLGKGVDPGLWTASSRGSRSAVSSIASGCGSPWAWPRRWHRRNAR